MERLTELLKRADAAYYLNHEPIMSDAAYDALSRMLNVKSTGAPISDEYNSPHPSLMGGIKGTPQVERVLMWAKNRSDYRIRIERKYDGVPISLIYVDGTLYDAVTRGHQGLVGVSVYNHAIVAGLPTAVATVLPILEIRVELWLPKDNTGVLTRSKVAGWLRAINPTPLNDLHATVHGVGSTGTIWSGWEEFYKWAQKQGFSTAEDHLVFKDQTHISDAFKYCIDPKNISDTIPTDGWVWKIDDLPVYLNEQSAKYEPDCVIALKHNDEIEATTLKDVVWSYSSRGRMTPIASLEPVQVGGATIRNVNLHNARFVQQYNRGDVVAVARSKTTSPIIVEVLYPGNDPIDLPDTCEHCGELLLHSVQSNGIMSLRCNNVGCGGALLTRIQTFLKRGSTALPLPIATLKELIKAGVVRRVHDIWTLHEHITSLTSVRQTSYAKWVDAHTPRLTLEAWFVWLDLEGLGYSFYTNVFSTVYPEGIPEWSAEALDDFELPEYTVQALLLEFA